MQKRTVARVALAVAGAAVTLTATTSAAFAESTYVKSNLSTSACTLTRYEGTPTGGHEYTYYLLKNWGNGTQTCTAWIRESTNGGSSWSVQQQASLSYSGEAHSSSWVYDGPGYVDQVVLQETGPAGTSTQSDNWY